MAVSKSLFLICIVETVAGRLAGHGGCKHAEIMGFTNQEY